MVFLQNLSLTDKLTVTEKLAGGRLASGAKKKYNIKVS